jgi:D-glycero-D-manno-heptose 1,7-bisphosphate phosphatase
MVSMPGSETLHPVRVTPAPRARGTGVAVFLDRDGVLNEVRGTGRHSLPPRSLNELHIVPEAAGSMERLHDAGFTLIVVSNQPDVARGSIGAETVLEITGAIVAELDLDDAYLCLHDGPDGCACRKPRPGTLHHAARDWGLDLAKSWMIGDRWVDVAAGNAAGARSLLLEHPYSWETAGGQECPPDVRPLATFNSLADAVGRIVELSASESP